MASAIYPLTKEKLIKGTVSINTGDSDKKIMLCLAAQSYNAAHEFYSSIASRATMTLTALGTITTNSPSAGILDAADTVCASVTGTACDKLVLIKDTGTEGTSPLIAWIEFTSVVPNGGNITMQWDSGGNRIFAL